MLNFLVVEDDINQCKNIVNYVSQKIPDMRLNTMTNTGKEALNIINNYKIDIILLDLGLPDLSGLEILKKLSNERINTYENSIIVVSGNNLLINKAILNPCVYSYISKPYGLEKMISEIESLCKYKEQKNISNKLKKEISFHLNTLGYNPSHSGTRYLADSIYEIYIRKDIFQENLKKDIYPILSNRYNKTINNIKCSITKATKVMCIQCNENIFKEYFKYYNTPTVKEVIFTILSKI